MNRLTKKLVLSILTVVLTVVALGTTTFAWFTLGNTVELDQFQAEIIVKEGLEVSLDNVNWFNVLPGDMIEEFINNKSPFVAFNHMTSSNGIEFKTITQENTLTEVIANTYTGRDNPDDRFAAAATGFISLKLYFQSPNLTEIWWTGATLTGDEKTTWAADVPFVHSDGKIYGPELVANDLNEGKLYQHEIDNFKKILGLGEEDELTAAHFGGSQVPVSSADAFRISIVSASNVADVYEKAEAPEDEVGNTHIGAYNGTTSIPVSKMPGAASFYESKNNVRPFGFTNGQNITLPETISKLESEIEVEGEGEEEPQTITVEGIKVLDLTPKGAGEYYNTGFIIVNIWVEGYDQEAYNSILDLIINIQLNFEARK